MGRSIPWLWIVAGINGAGKSTLCMKPDIKRLIGTDDILNPDVRTRALLAEETELELGEANLRAAQLTDEDVKRRIQETRKSFGVETVLSSSKFDAVLDLAKSKGWKVGLIYFALPSVEDAIQRVKLRVLTGGHHVPEHKIRERWGKSLPRMRHYLDRVDVAYILGNPTERGAILVAKAIKGRIQILEDEQIPWLPGLLDSQVSPDQ